MNVFRRAMGWLFAIPCCPYCKQLANGPIRGCCEQGKAEDTEKVMTGERCAFIPWADRRKPEP